MADVTQILSQIEAGDPAAAAQLLPIVYEELRRLAASKMAQERPGQTLQATALVHEAYLRLVEAPDGQQWDNRGHFFAAAARAMRRILVERARRRRSAKHGGEWKRVELCEGDLLTRSSPDEVLALDEALNRLAEDEATAADLVNLRLFAGMSVEEAASSLGISRAAAYRHWTFARAWLKLQLADTENEEESENEE
jgi:RNA polymerase sigma factor (TIGR02999 family)